MNDTMATPASPAPRLQLDTEPIGTAQLALYAAASGDHNLLHLDEDSARASGFERPVVHGMLTMACAARLFTSAFGAGSLRSLETRFTGVALRGQRLQIEGELKAVDGDLATYTVEARDQADQILVSGSATVRWRASAPPDPR